MAEIDQLEKAIDLLEAQRSSLGDGVVEAALAPLRAQLAALNESLIEPLNEVLDESSNHSMVEPLSEPGPEGAGRASPFAGERRIVTILFCDVKGSTAMAEKLDPEEWARTIQDALEYFTRPVRRHDGMVAEVRGDGILAFFGAPLAHEDDPQRAVLAGLEIIAGIRTFQEQLQHQRELDFAVRVGIHTGLVVVGEVSRMEQGEYAAFGDAVNLAARMEQTAQPGTVQISAQTYQLVHQAFDCEPLGEIGVKGKRRPVRAYRVLGLKAEPAPLRGLDWQGLHSQMVGREAEFAAARESVERLLAGQGGILGVFGEAGIGKSRLIEEIRAAFPLDRLRWLEAQALTYGPSVPYWPFQEILRGCAGINDQDGEDQAWDKLESRIAALFLEDAVAATGQSPSPPSPTVAEVLPYLASLLGLKVRDEYAERVTYLDGETLGKQIFLACRRFFERLAGTGPVVLVFEDLQWMDESSVSLLEHLLPLVEQVPLLIAGLSRPFWETPAGHLIDIVEKEYALRYTSIQLVPLSESDSAQLVHNLLEIKALPTELRARILSKAEGNPFFLEEILRALIDQGAIRREAIGGRWRATAEIESLAIPGMVQRVILSRLDRLEEETKGVLRVAAVIGRSFLYRVLQAVAAASERLDGHLTELQAIQFIREIKRTPELEFIFKHALAQEAIYESILLDKRRQLHVQVGAAIETLFAGRLEEFYALLAHHYAKAEAWDKAQAYLLKAADQAEETAANSQALENYRQALAVSERNSGQTWNPVERARLARKMGEVLFRRGDWAQALGFLRKALVYLGRPLPDSRWAVRWALLLETAQQIGRGLLPGLFPKQRARAAAEEQLLIYQSLQVLLAGRDPELFLLLAFRMLNFSQRNGLPVGVARASAGLGIVLGESLHFPRLAGHYLRQAVKTAEQLQRPDVLGMSYTGLLSHEGIMRGEWDAALEYGQRSAGAQRRIGNLGGYSVAVFITSTILIWKGDFARALADGQEQAQLGREADETQTLASGLWVQGFAERCLGQLEAAGTHLEQALEIAEASGNVFLRVQAANQLGQCYLHHDQWQVALDTLETNERFIAEHNFSRGPFPNAMLRNGLASAYLLAAEQSDTQERKTWLERARSGCRAALKWGKFFRPGQPEALRLQGRYAWLRGNTARARGWWQRSLAEAEGLGMPYELGLTHLEIGQRLGGSVPQERAHLEEAESIFSRIGAQRDLAKVREFLSAISPNWTVES